MEATPRGDRLHIAIFGRRNAGKSSLINALSDQDVAIVSPEPGTTTDPVYRPMELLPIGPVVLIDTAGIDDPGDLGRLRVRSTLRVLNKTDLALLVIDATRGPGEDEKSLVNRLKDRAIPVIGTVNKVDLVRRPDDWAGWADELGTEMVPVSGRTGEGLEDLKRRMIDRAPSDWAAPAIVGDLLDPGDLVVLVVPVDLAAPKGRLILPQVQTLRDVLDHDAYAVVAKEYELREAIENQVTRPKLVVTDSQAFLKVAADTPPDVMLTSFSILFARYKGDLEELVAGARAVDSLRPGDRVLIAEACTHHRMADDIGRVKIPRWLRQRVGGDLEFHWVSGVKYPDDLESYRLVVHCGACMINRREMLSRIGEAKARGVPIVNYGVLIAYLLGLLPRALEPFPAARQVIVEG
ncbi:MAG: [FeFe] hydrogenase H-cluster maturation GTPase HydF [Bacillota bacterium]